MKKVMIDIGHYKDCPGKRTPDGVQEFTLNEAVAKEIQKLLSSYIVEVKLNYAKDATDSLNLRVKAMNEYKPDLIISIHHNAYQGVWGDATGVEVWHHPLPCKGDVEFAKLLLPKLVKYTGLLSRGIKQEAWAVLTSNYTSVLVEGGFMDSKKDSFFIRTADGQGKYAQAVAETVIEFLKLEKKSTAKEPAPLQNVCPTCGQAVGYIVQKGDSLYQIAKSHGTTVEKLIEKNGLKSDVIQPGQILKF